MLLVSVVCVEVSKMGQRSVGLLLGVKGLYDDKLMIKTSS